MHENVKDIPTVGKQSLDEALHFYNNTMLSADSPYLKLLLRCWFYTVSKESDFNMGKNVNTFVTYKHGVSLLDLCMIVKSKFIEIKDIGISSTDEALTILMHNHNEH